MATQEERMASLESFRTETLYAYKDMAMELAMVKGLTSDAIGRLAVLQREVQEFRAESVNRFDRLDTRIDGIVASLALIMQKLDEGK